MVLINPKIQFWNIQAIKRAQLRARAAEAREMIDQNIVRMETREGKFMNRHIHLKNAGLIFKC